MTDDSDCEAPKEETEAEENERKAKEEDEKKDRAEKQAKAETIHTFVAIFIILGMATATVYFKLKFFPEPDTHTFDPLPQQVTLHVHFIST